MNRRSSISIALVALAALALGLQHAELRTRARCSRQQTDGTLQCVAVDSPSAITPATSTAATSSSSAASCVSAVQCDPASTMDINGVCVGTGGTVAATCRTPGARARPASPAPSSTSSRTSESTAPIHVELYDPIVLLRRAECRIASYDSVDGGSYVFQDFTPPPPRPRRRRHRQRHAPATASPARADRTSAATTVPRGHLRRQEGGLRRLGLRHRSGGAYIAKFYKDPKPHRHHHHRQRDHAGRGRDPDQGRRGAAPASSTSTTTLTAIDPALTTTGASGVAIVAAPIVQGTLPDLQRHRADGDADHLGAAARRLGAESRHLHRFHPM